jgi:hypothetical protein
MVIPYASKNAKNMGKNFNKSISILLIITNFGPKLGNFKQK